MQTLTTHPNPSDELVAQATWIRVFGGAVRGLTHSLGNRLHSLEMTLGSLEPGETMTAAAASSLDVESATCAELVRLYRMLPLNPDSVAEASRVADIMPDAVLLFGHHIDDRSAHCGVDIVGEPPAVLVAPQAFVQAMLIILCGAVANADDGSAPNVSIGVAGEEDSVRIDVSASALSNADDAEDTMTAARWLLRSSNAKVERITSATGPTIRITLPSLSAARRRERAGA